LLDVFVVRVDFFRSGEVHHRLVKQFHLDFQIAASYERLNVLGVLFDALVKSSERLIIVSKFDPRNRFVVQ